MPETKSAFFPKQDIREMPAYGIVEAAHYLGIPTATLRSWVLGRYYPTGSGRKFFEPIVRIPDKEHRLLSFTNLVEAHVLSAIRRDYGIAFWKVRNALEYLKKRFPSRHPLADQSFETDGIDLFVEKFGQLINISKEGQVAMRAMLQVYLRRIERDSAGLPVRLYPFTRRRQPDEPRMIVIDPSISSGRPVLAGTGIATTIIAQRYKAGESIEELADDYGRQPSEIQEAIRCELWLEAA